MKFTATILASSLLLSLLAAAQIVDPKPGNVCAVGNIDGTIRCSLSNVIVGTARVIDGDTIEIKGQRVRLWGIDAPEHTQKCRREAEWVSEYQCGQDAKSSLMVLLRDRTVTCAQRDQDRHGRVVATCSVGEPNENIYFGDLGGAMVRQGWAVDYTRYSKGYYAQEQAKAKAEKRGIWSGSFDMPEDWRRK